jgi:signal transduction histidine kinase
MEVVNPGFPNLEGRNILDFKDAAGKSFVRDYTEASLAQGSVWVDFLWPRPGTSIPSRKHAYVKSVKYRDETFIVGSGAYLD